MIKKSILFSFFILLLIGTWWVFSSFQPEPENPKPTKQDLIEAAVQDRINHFIKTRQKICKQDRLVDAALRVDSILIETAKLQRDTVSKPPKPFKPERPIILNLEDTTPIAPILRAEKDTFINKKNEY